MGIILPNSPVLTPGDSVRQDLWTGLTSMWAPCVTGRASLGTSFTDRNGVIRDLGSTKHGLRRSGSTPTLVPSPYGFALNFTGTTGGAMVPATGSATHLNYIHQTGIFSISALVRSTAVGTFSVIADSSNGSSSSKGFALYQTSGGLITCAVANAVPGFVVSIAAATSLVSGAWTHFLITCDGTTGRLWINGRRNGSDAAVGTLAAGDASRTVGIGAYGGGTNTNSWTGQIAYIGFWNRVIDRTVAKTLADDPLIMFRRKQRIIGKSIVASNAFIPQSIVIC